MENFLTYGTILHKVSSYKIKFLSDFKEDIT